jgi:1,4-alpha-glucan branching enzyme
LKGSDDAGYSGMILTAEELGSLVEARQRSPHQLLGMHPLGDGSGLVVRAMVPGAKKVEVAPVHVKDKPRFSLKEVHEAGVFEGTTNKAKSVYAYDLVVTDSNGNTRQFRDAFSFLPTLGEMDVYLFAQGNELRIYEKLGAHLRVIDGVPGTSFAVWAPNAQRVSVVGNFNNVGWAGSSVTLIGAIRDLGNFHTRRG